MNEHGDDIMNAHFVECILEEVAAVSNEQDPFRSHDSALQFTNVLQTGTMDRVYTHLRSFETSSSKREGKATPRSRRNGARYCW